MSRVVSMVLILMGWGSCACGGLAEDSGSGVESVEERQSGTSFDGDETGSSLEELRRRELSPDETTLPEPIDDSQFICETTCETLASCEDERERDCARECELSLLEIEAQGCLEPYLLVLQCISDGDDCERALGDCLDLGLAYQECVEAAESAEPDLPQSERLRLCVEACEHQASCGGDPESCEQECLGVTQEAEQRGCGAELDLAAFCILGHPECPPPEGWCPEEEESYFACLRRE